MLDFSYRPKSTLSYFIIIVFIDILIYFYIVSIYSNFSLSFSIFVSFISFEIFDLFFISFSYFTT